MPEPRELFDRAALDPDPTFTAELEHRLTGSVGAGSAGWRPSDNPRAGRPGSARRWTPVAILATAAAVALVAVLLTAGDRSRVTTVPETIPPPTTLGPAPSVTVPPTAPPTSTATPGTSPQTAVPPVTTAGPVTSSPPPPVPPGFSPASVTFVSPTRGWMLGGACGQPTCPAVSIVTTDDRGQTWHAVGAPSVAFGDADAGGDRAVRFANEHDGYVFGGELWSTHDGAATWQQVALPGAEGSSDVVALETAGGTTYAVYTTGDGFRIASSPATSDDWRLDPFVIPYGAGPVPSIQLVLHGRVGYLLENDRLVTAGARLGTNGAWYEWTPPGVDEGGPAVLAASSETDLAAIISGGIWGGPATPMTVLARSSDAGQGFRMAPTEVPLPPGAPAAVTSPRPATAVVAGADQSGAPVLVATFDSGQTWSTVWTGSGAANWGDLGFTTLDQGVVILGHDDRSSELLMTRDGGHTWGSVTFGR